jgi:hypothetical protein
MKQIATIFVVLLALAHGLNAHALPDAVKQNHAGLALVGEGVLRFLGMKVYDAKLWSANKKPSTDDVLALELTYAMSFQGKEISDRSLAEIRKHGGHDEAKLKRWGEEMLRVFPNVKKGDSLIGVMVPGKEARFYSREKFIAAIPDAEFARAFFDIWLSEKTSEPRLREKLLGSGTVPSTATGQSPRAPQAALESSK